jgi:hypothetical protein
VIEVAEIFTTFPSKIPVVAGLCSGEVELVVDVVVVVVPEEPGDAG